MNRSPLQLLAVASLLLFPALASVVHAQSAEQKKLEYLVGKWKTEVEIKGAAGAASTKGNGTETCEWFAKAHVICRAELSSPAGAYTSIRTLSYVPALKQYSSYTIDSLGYAVLALGQLKGSAWTFTTDLGASKMRSTMQTSGDRYTLTADYAGSDGKWMTTSTSTATRSK